ncbi:hypothetical protein OPT61_g6639 [Boeremia exigua]|uniref:Uncharacterized protein n=1 Tax=Boeremia exigua TaxID=749465 RepID=A0ACC2I5V4_9PLEO|nr:hypothetical protein OPT61_g6639 [Boeremia exigua]
MRVLSLLYATLLSACGAQALRSDKVKLSNIQSLTLRKGLDTSHRRVAAMPQLSCIGGSAKGLYEVDVMRCKNSGSDYDSENIQWTCTASLPEEFKLGSTDVICEGYDYPEDPYILKGSCGVEYRLVLTDKGHERYGKGNGGHWWGGDDEGSGREGPKTLGEQIAAALFWMVFIGVAGWIIFNIVRQWGQGPAGAAGAAGNRPGWGGGGGGWGGNDGYDDPPPPYDYQGRPGNKSTYGTNQPQGWRPGPWSAALGGAAAGYAAGRMGSRGNQTNSGWGSNSGGWNNGEGSSRSSSGSGSSFSNTRHESTGFGSTSRR